MSSNEFLHKQYAAALAHHSEGHALYHPVSASILQPGSVGYFDFDGDWQPIVILTDSNALRSGSWYAPEGDISVTLNSGISWGAKTSNRVSHNVVGGEVGAGGFATGLPVDAKAIAKFKSESDFEVVLATDIPVTRREGGHAGVYSEWMNKNVQRMQARYGSEVKEHGIWIITKTYATRRCAIAIMQSEGAEVEMGLEFQLPGLVTLTPSTKWLRRHQDRAWSGYEDPDGLVVFIGGIWYRSRRFHGGVKPVTEPSKQKKMFRDASKPDGPLASIQVDEEPGGMLVELKPHIYGISIDDDYEMEEESDDEDGDDNE